MWSESFPALPRAQARSRFRRELTRASSLACWRLRRRRLVTLVADWVTIPGRLPLGGGRMLVAEPMAVEPGCDIVRRARELAAAGEVTALVDAAALGFADSDSERILAGSRGNVPCRGAIGAPVGGAVPRTGRRDVPVRDEWPKQEGIRLARRRSHSRFRSAPACPW